MPPNPAVWQDNRGQRADGGSFFSRAELPGQVVASGVEVRTVPSALYPTVSSALLAPRLALKESSRCQPLMIRVLPGVYHEHLHVTEPVVIVGAGKELPVIWGVGREGITVSGSAASSCVLRRLRLCAEAGCHSLCVKDASPLIESCELVGSGGDPVRGAPAGLDVKGSDSRPIVRGCRILDHAGAGVAFSDAAGGLVGTSEISRCACGLWLEGGSNPLIWRNTVACHRGAGVVVRANGRGCILGNRILNNGAGGVLVESSRRAATVIVQNKIWANSGCDLRQGPSTNGLAAGLSGTLLFANTVGQQDNGPSTNQGIDLVASWPKRVVSSTAELLAAVQEAPGDRIVLIEIQGCLTLEEPLVLDRPVVLAGEPILAGSHAPSGASARGELRAGPKAAAVVVVEDGADAIGLWRLRLVLPPHELRRATASCVEASGSPVIVDCDLDASYSPPRNSFAAGDCSALTHAVRASGPSSHPVLIECLLRRAQGSGLLLLERASALLIRCRLSSNNQGGALIAEGASLMAESCEISGNGHFGVVVGTKSGPVLLGRTDLANNASGSMWHCGGENASSSLSWLDQCSLTGAPAASSSTVSPAVLVGSFASMALWDCMASAMQGDAIPLRAEAASHTLVAGDGPTLGWQGWASMASGPSLGQGDVTWIDVSGASPPMPTQKPLAQSRPMSAASAGSAGYPQTSSSRSGWTDAFRGRLSPQPQPAQQSKGKREPRIPLQEPPARHDGGHGRERVDRNAVTDAPIDAQNLRTDPSAHPEKTIGLNIGEEAEPSSEVPSKWAEEDLDTDATPQEKDVSHDVQPQPAGGHESWLKSRMESQRQDWCDQEAERRTLFEILSMLALKDNCKDVPDSIGLGGKIMPNDPVLLRGHTGRWMGLKDGKDLICQAPDRAGAETMLAEFKGTALKHDARVSFRLTSSIGGATMWLGVSQSGDVGLVPNGTEPAARFVLRRTPPATLLSGMAVYLKSSANGKLVEVDGSDVRAKGSMEGTRQRIVVEKIPAQDAVPAPCDDFDLSDNQKSWVYLRGAQLALLDKQNLARFLASHKAHCKALLKAYTTLWESEWRRQWRTTLEEDSAPSSPGSRQSSRSGSVGAGGATSDSARPRARSRGRMTKREWIMGMVGGTSSTADDKSNGNLFVSAMRSFFANAIKMSQLEADPVQRVIEAFAEALVADASFLSCFSNSMLPEKERKTYKTPDEVIFGLSYTTLMLNTDMHNKQVAQKMWDTKKFVGAGKDCGVTGGLMAEIFKHVQSEEL
eukprot:TRINITY_DN74304_c0_g1_i1.p1 TRINITY_DN74304_c0_g1~~TRINITY_DN74304_c0_g1_i1.p1  ORF type:complete len:1265 (-),score=176.35 TRINITY_DN74304_c0_g1_i1:136-3930(-)